MFRSKQINDPLCILLVSIIYGIRLRKLRGRKFSFACLGGNFLNPPPPLIDVGHIRPCLFATKADEKLSDTNDRLPRRKRIPNRGRYIIEWVIEIQTRVRSAYKYLRITETSASYLCKLVNSWYILGWNVSDEFREGR